MLSIVGKYTATFILLFNSIALLAQQNDRDISALIKYQKQKNEYMQKIRADQPEITREELRNLLLEFHKNKFPAPVRVPTKNTDLKQNSEQLLLSSFNMVPDSIEYQALKIFFEQMDGPDWVNRSNWDYPTWKTPATATYQDFQDWYGVIVEDGDVIEVNFSGNGLYGSIPPAIGKLTALEELRLSIDAIDGPLPDEIGDLSALSVLTIVYTDLSGSIPSTFGNLNNLQYLDLSVNYMTGVPPSTLGDLDELNVLNLSMNNFEGPIPNELASLPSLSALYLESNKFDFGDLEQFFNGLTPIYSNFYYDYQHITLGTEQNLMFHKYEQILIPFSPDGINNIYQWQKLTGGQWQDISGATSAEYSKSNATLSDGGQYRCKVTNSVVQDLELFSHIITINIDELPAAPSVEDVHVCSGDSATLTAIGSGTINWYETETDSTVLANGSTFSIANLLDTTTYYVSQTINTDESKRVPITAYVGPLFIVTEDKILCKEESTDLSVTGENLLVNWAEIGSGSGFTVSPEDTTTYDYTVEDEYGCTASGEVTIAVVNPPVANIHEVTPVCHGQNATLEAEEITGATYVWHPIDSSGRSITVPTNEVEEYTVTVTSANGCTATASTFVPLTSIAVASEDQEICVIDSAMLTATGGDTYAWSTGDTTQQIVFNPSAPGIYTFTVTATKDGCSAIDDVVVTVEEYCPGTPISFLARAISTSEIELNWQEPHGNHVQYVIQKRNAQNIYETVATLPKGTRKWNDTVLVAETVYHYLIYSEVEGARSDKVYASARTFTPNENYIMETQVLVENITDADFVTDLGYNSRNTTWNYMNGLGSDMQTVVEAGSPTQKDIIQPIIYDTYGMRSRQYLPYTVSQPSKPGNFRDEAEQEVLAFYVDPPDAVASSDYPFSETLFEKSPQNKVLQQGAPGAEWQLDTGRPVIIDETTNSSTDVLDWTFNESISSLEATAYYPAAQLTKNVTISADSDTTVSYKDILGRKLKQEVHLGNGETITTYFIYNNRGSLLYRITPEVIKDLSAGLPKVIGLPTINEECYSYEYDEQERLISEKWPDKEKMIFVYDPWDRPVLSQSGNQRQLNQWSFSKYDRFNRPVLTGLFDTIPLTRAEMQIVVETHYAKTSAKRFEVYQRSEGAVHGYTNASYPVLSDVQAYLSVTYFDNYDFIADDASFGTAYNFNDTAMNCDTVEQGTYCFPTEPLKLVKGKITGSKTRIVNQAQWLNGCIYYDSKGRTIQAVTDNHTGGQIRVSSLYNFAGWLLATYSSMDGPDGNIYNIKRRFIYDHTGRLKEGYHELFKNGVGQGEVFLAENNYNEIGELIEKNLHIQDGVPLQSIDYRYNIRGWLKSINDPGLQEVPGVNESDINLDMFGMDFFYHKQLMGIPNN